MSGLPIPYLMIYIFESTLLKSSSCKSGTFSYMYPYIQFIVYQAFIERYDGILHVPFECD